MNLNQQINQLQFQKYAAYLKAQGLSDASIKRKLSSLSGFQKFLIKKKLLKQNISSPVILSPTTPSTRPPFSFFNRYLIAATLLIILSALGFGLYSQTILKAKNNLAYSTAASQITPNRILSFQGRLTDTFGNPISSNTGILFNLYNSSIGGTLLYNSGTGNSQTVTPDENGIFSVVIGKTHGAGIPSSVFSENADVYLEIVGGGETMTPRQQIATVGYALNAETLQGLPPSASGFKDTVMVIDGSGNINLGETSPSIKSASGTLGIEGQAVLIKTSTGSGGNITLNPDANGTIKLITSGLGSTAVGQIEATNANFLTGNLFSGIIRNDNRGYNFLAFKNYDVGTTTLNTRFSIDAGGIVTVGTGITAPQITLSVGASSGFILQSDANGNASWVSASATGVGTTYSFTNGLTNSSNTITLGGALTQNTNFTVGSTSALFIDSTSGFIGLGTTAPSKKLDVAGDINLTGTIFSAGISGSAGQILTSTGVGLSWVNSSSIGTTYTANNGLSLISGAFGIGGTLTRSTQIGTSSFSLSFIGTGGTVGFSQTANGYIGIGTSSPSARLEINSTNDPTLVINNSRASGTIQFKEFGTLRSIIGYGDAGAVFSDQTADSLGIRSQASIHLGSGPYSGLTVNTSNYVGVGTTNPAFRFQVTGDATYPNDITNGGAQLSITGATATTKRLNLGYDTTTGNGFGFIAAGNQGVSWTTLALQPSGGNVGIGTTSPSKKLDVIGDINLTGTIFAAGASGSSGQVLSSTVTGLQWVNASSVGGTYVFNNGLTNYGSSIGLGGTLTQNTNIGVSSFGLTFTNSGTLLNLNSNGNVGIGTTSPSKKLDVAGDINLTGTIFSNGTSGTSGQVLSSTGTGLQWVNAAGLGTTYSVTNGLSMSSNVISLGGTLTTDTAINLASSNFSFLGLGNTQSLYLSSTGNVGIGTTAPGAKLDVNGGVRAANGAGYALYNGASFRGGFSDNGSFTGIYGDGNGTVATPGIAIDNGNIGIGVTSPLAKLEIDALNTAVATRGNLYISTTDAVAVDKGGQISLGGQWSTGYLSTSFGAIAGRKETAADGNAAGYLQLSTSTSGGGTLTERLRITSSGSVGIGTTSPSKKLDVAGDINLTGTIFSNGTSGTSGQVLSSTGTGLQWVNAAGLGTTYSVTNGLSMSSNVISLGGTLTTDTAINLASSNFSFLGLGNTQSLYLSSTGNVGIGTTSPSKKLDVAGDINLTGTIFSNGTSGTSGQVLTSTGTGLQWVNASSVGGTNTASNGLTMVGADVRIGGTLTAITTITNNAYRFNLSNLNVADDSYSNSFSDVPVNALAYNKDISQDFLQFNPPNLAEYSIGGTWAGTTIPANLFTGIGSSTNAVITNGWEGYRLTWTNFNYRYLEDLYIAESTNGHSMNVTVETSANSGVGWTNVFTTPNFSSWPGHYSYKKTHSTSGKTYFRITFTPTWSGSYPANDISLYSLRYFGSYNIDGATKLYTWDSGRNVTFNGSLYTPFGSSTLPSYSFSGDTNTGLYRLAADKLSLTTAGTDRLVVDASGNVGIGTTNPTAPLTVKGQYTSGGTSLLLLNGDGSTGTNKTTQIRFGYNGGDNYQHYITTRHNSSAPNNAIDFYTSDGTWNGAFPTNAVLGLSVNNGSVGIGTTSPSKKLDVAGDINLTGTIFSNGTSGTSGQVLSSTGTGLQWVNAAGLGTTYSVTNGLSMASNVISLGGTLTSDTNLTVGNTSVLFLGINGNVGIGTTDPGIYKFNVAGNSYSQAYYSSATGFNIINNNVGIQRISPNRLQVRGYDGITFYNTRDSLTPMAIGANGGLSLGTTYSSVDPGMGSMILEGNLGIGTTSPSKKLDVAGDINLTGTIFSNGTSGTSGQVLSSTGTGLQWVNAASVGGTYVFNNGLTNYGSSIGLGGTLTQNTQIGTSSFNLSFIGLGGTQGLFLASSGNVGIGTTNPGFKLEISGGGQTPFLTAGGGYDGIYVNPNSTSAQVSLETSGGYEGGMVMHSTNRMFIGSWSNTPVDFRVSNSTAMTIINGGNVGIGTTNPLQKLDVNGSVNIGGSLSIGSSQLVTNLNTDLLDGLHSSAFLQIGNTGSLPYVNNATNTTLTRSGTGPYTLGLNLGSTNTWVAPQYFQNGILMVGTSANGGSSLISGAFIHGSESSSGQSYFGIGEDRLIKADQKYTTSLIGSSAPNCESGNIASFFDGSSTSACTFTGVGWTDGVSSLSVGITFSDVSPTHYWNALRIEFPYNSQPSGVKIEKYYDTNSVNGWSCTDGDQVWATTYDNSSFTAGYLDTTAGLGNGICQLRFTFYGNRPGSGTIRIGEIMGYQYYYGPSGGGYVSTAGGDTIYGNLNIGTTANNKNLYTYGYLYNGGTSYYSGSNTGSAKLLNLGLGGASPSASYALNATGSINLTGTIFSNGTSGTSGQVLSSTGTGLQWVNAAGLGTTYSVTNGLSAISSNVFGLGGTLTQNTQIGTSSFNFDFIGLGGTQSLHIDETGNVGIGTTNPGTLLSLKSAAANESASLGSELLSSSNWTLGAGWSGDFTVGFTHTTGNTADLTNTLAAVINNFYQIAYTVTGRTTGSFTVAFGGQSWSGRTATGTFGPKATTTDSLVITPTTDFDGTIVLSVKQITSSYSPTFALYDSTNTSSFEIRNSSASLYNTFVGKNAGTKNTTGSNNSALGTYALYLNTTGYVNSAQGDAALQNNTAGYANSAQGAYALQHNTIGYYNSAQGYAALSINTTGFYNSAQGVSALYSNTTGFNNSAQGVNALYSNTTGSNNSAQGVSALYSNTTGGANSAQGNFALYFAAGSSNTAIGYNTGRYYNGTTGNLTAINNSLLLGANASALNATGDTNEVVIGYNAIGNGSNSVVLGNDSITTTVLKGNVGIGTTNPLQKLDVNGSVNIGGSLSIGSSQLVTNLNTDLLDGLHSSAFLQTGFTGFDNYNSWTANVGTSNLTVGSTSTLTFAAGTGLQATLVGNTLTFTNIGVGTTYSAANGLTLTGNSFGLGGTLTQNTNLTIGNTSVLFLGINGNVGIGTTSPTGKLTIDAPSGILNSSESAGTLVLRSTDTADADIGPQLRFSGHTGYGGTYENYAFAIIAGRKENSTAGNFDGYLQFATTNSSLGGAPYERMRLNAAGNLGIGTTSPGTTLEVSSAYRTITGDQAGDAQVNMAVMSSDAAAADKGGILGLGGKYFNNNNLVFGAISGRKDTGNSGYLSLYSYKATVGLVEGIRLTSTGNVGIGTTAPSAKLEMSDSNVSLFKLTNTAAGGGVWDFQPFISGISNAGLNFKDVSSNVSRMVISSTGNVGIGTTSPSKKLDVAGDINLTGTIFSNGTSGTSGQVLTSTGTGLQWVNAAGLGTTYSVTNGLSMSSNVISLGGTLTTDTAINLASSNFSFLGLGNTQSLYLSSTGNVGIGTTAPGAKLDVNGGVRAANGYGYALYNGASFRGGFSDNGSFTGIYGDGNGTVATPGIAIDNGNIGIGTTSPGQKLTVVGNIETSFSGTTEAELITNGTFNSDIIGWTASGVGASWTGSALNISQAGTGYNNIFQNTVVIIPGEQYYYSFDAVNNSGTSLFFQQGGNTTIRTISTSATYTGTFIGATDPSYPNTIRFKINNAAADWTLDNISIKKLTPGNIIARGLILGGANTNGGSGGIKILDSGNVGLGTTNPSKKLDVAGDINLTGTIFSNGTSGTNGQVLTSTGTGLQWVNSANVGGTYTFTNGLTNTTGTVSLGGTLAQNTNITVGNTSAFFINSTSSFVGLGTTQPNSRLEVNGDIRTTSGSGGIITLFETDTTRQNRLVSGANSLGSYLNATYSSGGSAVLRLQTASADRLTINSSGNVGIGTTAPAQRLDVNGNIQLNGNTLMGKRGSDSAAGNLLFVSQAASGYILADSTVLTTIGAKAIQLLPNNGTMDGLTMLSNSNVGLGTTAPSKKLDVAGDINLTGTIFAAGTSGTAGQVLSSTGTGLQWITSTGTGVTYSFINGLTNSSNTISLGGTLTQNTQIGTSSFNFDFIGLGGTQSLHIDETGNVGIGTTSPSKKLDIVGDINLAGTIFAAGASGTNGQVLTSTGTGLQWVNSANVGGTYTFTNGLTNTTGTVGLGGTLAQNTNINLASSSLSFLGLSSQSLFLASNGNVGIGFTNPSYSLQIAGASFAAGSSVDEWINVTTTNGVNLRGINNKPISLATDAGVSVGIGTTGPSKKLDVAGDINLTGTIFAAGASGTSGQILSSTATGLQWINSISVGTTYTFTNGLTNTANVVGLGGTLTQNTQIGTSSFNLSFIGLGGTQGLFINSAGQVGIGTTNLYAPLSFGSGLSDKIYLWHNAAATNTFGLGVTDATLQIFAGTSGNINFKTGNSTGTSIMYMNSSGNVGIGTTNPLIKLHTSGGNGGVASLGSTAAGSLLISNTDPNYGMLFGTLGSGVGWIQQQRVDGTATGYNLSLQPVAGNVGIGTTNPFSKLSIGGTGLTFTGLYSYGINNGVYGESDSGYGVAGKSNSLVGVIGFTSTGYAVSGNSSSTGVGGYFGSTSGYALLTSTGNVGFGTTNPVAELHVVGVGTSTIAIFNGSGNVGIGTSNPTAKLTISNNSAALPLGGLTDVALHIANSDSTGSRILLDAFAGNTNLTLRRANGTGTSQTPLLSGDPMGTIAFMGYGASAYSPSSRASLTAWAAENWSDTAQSTYLTLNTTAIGSSASSERMRITSEGNVGIGTTNPVQPLHVVGGILSQAGSGLTITEVGTSNGASMYVSGGFNISNMDAKGINFYTGTNVGASILRMSIGNSGYVGIGLNSANITNQFQVNVGNTAAFTIGTSGNVGIGTSNPGVKLEINGSDLNSSYIKVVNTTTSSGATVGVEDGTGGGFFRAYGQSFAASDLAGRVGFGNNTSIGSSGIVVFGNSNSTSGGVGSISLRGGGYGAAAENLLLNKDGSYFTNGNVGIGTSVPGNLLTLSRNSSDGKAHLRLDDTQASGSSYYLSSGGVSAGVFSIADQSVVRLVINGGNVGIGITSPTEKLVVEDGNIIVNSNTSNSAKISLENTTIGTSGQWMIASRPTRTLGFWNTALSADVLSMNANGQIGIGATAGTHRINVVGTAGLSTGTAWTNSSDIRLKTVIGNLAGSSLDKLLALRPISFRWNDLHNQKFGTTSDKLNLGFVAQEIETVLPDMVTTDDEGYKWYNPSGFESLLTAGVQELNAKISDINITAEGQINLNYNVSDSVLAGLGYQGSKNEIEAATYSLTSSTGQVVTKMAQFAQVSVAKLTAGLVSTTNLIAQNIVAETTKSKVVKTDLIAPLDSVTGTIVVDGNLQAKEATFTAVYADKFIGKEGNFGDLMTNKISSLRSEMQAAIASIGTQTTSSIDLSAIASASAGWTFDIATSQATITGSLALTDNLIVGSKLVVNGDTQLGDAFITGRFQAGEIAVKDNFIETTNAVLAIQPSGLGTIDFLNHKLIIADNGEITVNGNLSVTGNITASTATVSGSLFANLINAGEINTKKLTAESINIATEAAQPIIAAAGTASAASNSAQLASNATAGVVALPTGKTELVISNSKITPNSIVYLTPAGSTNNEVIYLKSKSTDSFTIAVDHPLPTDININWWIIN